MKSVNQPDQSPDLPEQTGKLTDEVVDQHPSGLETPSQMPTSPYANNEGLNIFALLLAGIVGYGGVGWLLSHFLGWTLAIPIGVLLGLIASIYLVVKRYGKIDN